MLYFAYGSNLDPVQMGERCPGAHVVGLAALREHRHRPFGEAHDAEPRHGQAALEESPDIPHLGGNKRLYRSHIQLPEVQPHVHTAVLCIIFSLHLYIILMAAEPDIRGICIGFLVVDLDGEVSHGVLLIAEILYLQVGGKHR